jgi:hypothetical protein
VRFLSSDILLGASYWPSEIIGERFHCALRPFRAISLSKIAEIFYRFDEISSSSELVWRGLAVVFITIITIFRLVGRTIIGRGQDFQIQGVRTQLPTIKCMEVE